MPLTHMFAPFNLQLWSVSPLVWQHDQVASMTSVSWLTTLMGSMPPGISGPTCWQKLHQIFSFSQNQTTQGHSCSTVDGGHVVQLVFSNVLGYHLNDVVESMISWALWGDSLSGSCCTTLCTARYAPSLHNLSGLCNHQSHAYYEIPCQRWTHQCWLNSQLVIILWVCCFICPIGDLFFFLKFPMRWC